MKRYLKGAWALSVLVAVALGAATVAGAAGAGPMSGSDDEDEVALTGAAADRAGRAAVRAAGGGTAARVERDDGGYEVDVRGASGQVTEVDVDARFEAIPDRDAAEPDDADDADDDDAEGDDD